jgi:hypothetical protein
MQGVGGGGWNAKNALAGLMAARLAKVQKTGHRKIFLDFENFRG